MRIRILITIILISTSILKSEPIPIKGYVFTINKIPLEDMNVYLQKTTLGAVTDEDGSFIFYAPPGRYELIAKYMGFEIYEKEIFIAPDNQNLSFTIFLDQEVLIGDRVEVQADAVEGEISQYRVAGSELREMAAPRPDPLFMLQTLPGVSSRNTYSTQYQVRGGSFDENLIYINGFEVYQPQMIQKGILENPSIVNPLMVKSINLRTGVFPVNYGDRLSSVCDITYGFADDKKSRIGIRLGTTGVNAVVGKEIHRKFRVMLAARKQSYDFFDEAFYINGNFLSDYRDVQGLMEYKPVQWLTFETMGILVNSRYRVEPSDYTYKRQGSYELYYGPGDYEQHGYDFAIGGFKTKIRLHRSLVSCQFNIIG